MQRKVIITVFCGIIALVRTNVHLTFTVDTSIPNNRYITDNRLYSVSASTVSHCAVECRHQTACITFGYIPATRACQFYWDEITNKSSWNYLHSSLTMDYYRAYCSDIPGYLLYRSIDKCMHRFTTRQNFSGAFETCTNEGTTLFEPKTQQQMNFLSKDYAKRFWLGGFVDQYVPAWFWFSGDEISNTSSLWLPGEPESYTKCLEANIHGSSYGLNDKNCSFEREFYCQTA